MAPRMEPMPPMTMTTKVRMRMDSPMPDSTARMGPALTPARPASSAPSPKTRVYRSLMFTPRAPIISRLNAPARMRMPKRVRVNSRYRNTATSAPTTRMASR